MRKVYVVYGLLEKDFVKSVSFIMSLDYETSYGNLSFEFIKEFLDKPSAEVWIRSNGRDCKGYEGGLVIMEVYKPI